MAVRKEATDDDNDPKKVGTRFTVRDPHPSFNADPNIINEYGHTHYPKWVDHPTEKEELVTTTYLGKDQSQRNVIKSDFPKKVLVNNEEEEKALLGEKKKKGWDKE